MAAGQREELDKTPGLEAERMKAESAVAARMTASRDEHGRGPGLGVDGVRAGHAVAAVEVLDVLGWPHRQCQHLVGGRYTASMDHDCVSHPGSAF